MVKRVVLVLLVASMIVGIVLALSFRQQARAVTNNCDLLVPNNELSAVGLATPYQLLSPCHESNPNVSAFVQGAVLDLDSKHVSIYNPLVIDQGATPAIAPIVPLLPVHRIVALWFGFNGGTLTLVGGGSNGCKQGMQQFAYCNAPNFFAVANALHVAIPPLGVGLDGKKCTTVRDFSLVDQDQSDNVTTQYLVTATGMAQDTAANRTIAGGIAIANPSDERLLTLVDAALGCKPWMAPDLADNGNLVPALPLNELQAARYQEEPIARVPLGDPFVGPGNFNLLVRYRLGVDQNILADDSTRDYCQHLFVIAPARLLLDEQFTQVAASPDTAVANNLFTFLAQRFVATYSDVAPGLDCKELIGKHDPIKLVRDDNGVVISASIHV